MSKTTGSIIGSRNDGMGGRLIAILNALRIAQDYNLPFKVHWPVTKLTREEVRTPEDIFSTAFIEKYFLTKDDYSEIRNSVYELGTLDDIKNAKALKDRISNGDQILISDSSTSRQVFPWEDPETVAERIAEVFSDIEWNTTVREKIELIKEQVGDKKPIAYHIRRGDIINPKTLASNKLWPTKYFPREFYEEHLVEHDKNNGGKILIFTDEPKEVPKLQKVSNLAVAIDSLLKKSDFQLCQYDFLSLFSMSLCEPIFGPSGSGFSETAAIIGNTKILNIEIDLPENTREKAYKKIVYRLENEPENYFGFADIGQNFPFAFNYLRKIGKLDKMGDILSAYIEGGMDRGYAYTMYSDHCLQKKNYNGVLDLVPRARKLGTLADPAMSQMYLNAGRAFANKGNMPKSARALSLAFWLHPRAKNIDPEIVRFINSGLFSERNFYPWDKNFSRKLNRKSELYGSDVKKEQIVLPVEVIVRDWRLLLGKRVGPKFSNENIMLQREEKLLEHFGKQATKASKNSFRAIMAIERKDFSSAIRFSETALSEDDSFAIYWKRYAQALAGAEEFAKSNGAMQKAVDLSKNQICFIAFQAHLLSRSKRRDDAIKLLDQHIKFADGFPEIYSIAAQIYSYDKDHHRIAKQCYEKVYHAANERVRFLNPGVTIMDRIGNEERAFQLLKELERNNALAPKTRDRLKEIRARQ